jgi:hypothetical protein
MLCTCTNLNEYYKKLVMMIKYRVQTMLIGIQCTVAKFWGVYSFVSKSVSYSKWDLYHIMGPAGRWDSEVEQRAVDFHDCLHSYIVQYLVIQVHNICPRSDVAVYRQS